LFEEYERPEMKINEIISEQAINEGPLDFAKKLASGVRSLAGGGGFKTGYAAKRGQIQQKKDVEQNVKFAMEEWGKFMQSYNVRGATPTINDAVTWAEAYFKNSSIPISPANPEAGSKPFEIYYQPRSLKTADIANWLRSEFYENQANASSYTPPTAPPQLGEPVAPTPAAGSSVNTNQGVFTVGPAGSWVDAAGAAAPAEYTDQLNKMWTQQNTIQAAAQPPIKDVPSLMTTNAGEYAYMTLRGGFGDWYKKGAGPSTKVVDPAVVQRLNQIAKDLNLGQS